MSSVQPTCDCYFESQTGAVPTCQVCTTDSNCTTAGDKSVYGYCET